MLSEILSGLILSIVAIISVIGLLVIVMSLVGNLDYFFSPYAEVIKDKKERLQFIKVLCVIIISVLVLRYL